MRILLALLLFIFPSPLWADLQTADRFPSFDVREALTSGDYRYLGLTKGFLSFGAKTQLKDVAAELLFVEFMNRYCIACQKEAPDLVRFHQELEKDAAFRGKVKMLGVAIGNTVKEVEQFKAEYRIPFPIVSDRETIAYRKIGSPGGSPLVFILGRAEGEWVIVDGFKGECRYADLLMRARINLNINVARVTRKSLWVEEPLRRLTQPEAITLLRTKIASARITKSIPFDNGDLYVLAVGKERLFAKVEARRLICAVCHDILFIYVFDGRGFIRDLIAVDLTKDMNRPFSKADIERVRSNVIGRNMLTPFKFDKETDAVTSATLTSLVIYDSVFHGKELLEAIRNEGY